MGIPAGNALYAPIEQGNLPSYISPIDFTTVTRVDLHVSRQKDTTTSLWSTSTFISVTTNGLVAVYLFSGTSPNASPDAYIDGVYQIRPHIITPTLDIPCDRTQLYVMTP